MFLSMILTAKIMNQKIVTRTYIQPLLIILFLDPKANL